MRPPVGSESTAVADAPCRRTLFVSESFWAESDVSGARLHPVSPAQMMASGINLLMPLLRVRTGKIQSGKNPIACSVNLCFPSPCPFAEERVSAASRRFAARDAWDGLRKRKDGRMLRHLDGNPRP